MSDRVRFNYVLDVVIALAFVLSAVTGLAFLVMGSGGYQGGRNPGFQTEFLNVSREVWSDLHTWTSMVMIAGVAVHFLLHWNWIVCVTQRMLRPVRRKTDDVCPVT